MKSTLKISTTPYGAGLKPIIKIVRPTSMIESSDQKINEDDDPKDELINRFLRNPCNMQDNGMFIINTTFPVPFGSDNPTHWVTTIVPLDEQDVFRHFKHNVLNRVVPYEDIVKINREEIAKHSSVEKHTKITEFFNWLDEVGYCSWDEQQPTNPDGRPRN